jgi:hypothetical protein
MPSFPVGATAVPLEHAFAGAHGHPTTTSAEPLRLQFVGRARGPPGVSGGRREDPLDPAIVRYMWEP